MAITANQRAALEAEAKKRGIDPAPLIAEAERLTQQAQSAMRSAEPSEPSGEGDGEGEPTETSSDEPGQLFMYLLPFVTVGEVRKHWLKVDGPFPGDLNANAAEWAARISAQASAAPAVATATATATERESS